MITTPTPLFFIPFPSPVFSQFFAPSILHLDPLKFFGVSQIDKVPVRMSRQSISHSSSSNTACFTYLIFDKVRMVVTYLAIIIVNALGGFWSWTSEKYSLISCMIREDSSTISTFIPLVHFPQPGWYKKMWILTMQSQPLSVFPPLLGSFSG